ncbi:MAG: thioredoxin family protein [Clostridium sp.]|nr:thioredoxin family protein [Clostridium sp.]MCM1443696.1 thioredoxin family protein [Candidatus Amulumruptor caecigallinarius]
MKRKIAMILSMLILTVLLGGCTKYDGYVEISYSELEKSIENKETFPLVIGSATCSACELYKPTMEHFIKKYNIKVYYLDIDKLTDEEHIKLKGLVSFDSTPTTVFYKDGKLLHSSRWIIGAADTNGIIESFKSNGYIK